MHKRFSGSEPEILKLKIGPLMLKLEFRTKSQAQDVVMRFETQGYAPF